MPLSAIRKPPYGLEFMGKDWDRFRVDDPGTTRHRGERAGGHGELDERDGSSVHGRMRVGYGGTQRAKTNRCVGCGKRDQFRNPHSCPEGTEWRAELIDPHAAPPTMLALQEWCRVWALEALRVLKPGGHLLAFGGSRTYHRLVCAVEDAGFEIRDTICWLYGSGFPKSLDVGKAIDKRPGVASHRDFVAHLVEKREAVGLSRADVSEKVVGTRSGACWNWEHHQFPEAKWWPALRDLLGLDDERWGPVIAEAEREKLGDGPNAARRPRPGDGSTIHMPAGDPLTAPATPEAERWEGFGTALKPAHEPVVVARKPLSGTVAATVLEHGTGALNVDGCRVGTDEITSTKGLGENWRLNDDGWNGVGSKPDPTTRVGRWPANVVLDDQAAGLLDEQTGELHGAGAAREAIREADETGMWGFAGDGHRLGDAGGPSRFFKVVGQDPGESNPHDCGYQVASASEGVSRNPEAGPDDDATRFRYVAKASRAERNAGLEGFEEDLPLGPNGSPNAVGATRGSLSQPRANVHPTVKPISLMRWLVRLVTPPGGTVLDPFCGSGSTGCAAVLEGFDFIGLEREPEYVAIAEARIAWWLKHRGDGEAAEILAAGELRDSVEATGQLGMFD